MAHKSIERVAVVIPNLNGEDYIKNAIDSLLDQSFSSDVIVVDNASTDGSLEALKSYKDKIKVIRNNKNFGFAGGVNAGIKYAINTRYDAVALFNNDAVADKNWLKELVNSINQDENVGIATCKIQLENKDLIDSTGEFYTTWGLPFPRGRGQSVKSYNDEDYVFGASGGASLYRIDMLLEIGLFDEKFFAYYEDTDISYRAQLAGWKVAYNPLSITVHKMGETSKKMVKGFTVYQTMKNLPMLFWKNTPSSLLFPIGVRFMLAYTLILGKAVLSPNSLPALRGFLRSILLIPHTLFTRNKIQKFKIVSDHYIKSIIIHDLPPDQTGLRKLRKVFIGK